MTFFKFECFQNINRVVNMLVATTDSGGVIILGSKSEFGKASGL